MHIQIRRHRTRRLIRISTVRLQNVLLKLERKDGKYHRHLFIKNGLVQLIRKRKSIGLKWVNISEETQSEQLFYDWRESCLLIGSICFHKCLCLLVNFDFRRIKGQTSLIRSTRKVNTIVTVISRLTLTARATAFPIRM